MAALIVAYPLFYTIVSLIRRDIRYPEARRQHRFAVLFPAYKEDLIIEDSIRSFLCQEYHRERFEIVVISDHMQNATNERLAQLPITLLKASYDNSSKAKALNLAVDSLPPAKYAAVIILDADNIVYTNFLNDINNAINAVVMAIQPHRTAINQTTDTAILVRFSEEVNYTIIRWGQLRLHISSAPIGYGMAVD